MSAVGSAKGSGKHAGSGNLSDWGVPAGVAPGFKGGMWGPWAVAPPWFDWWYSWPDEWGWGPGFHDVALSKDVPPQKKRRLTDEQANHKEVDKKAAEEGRAVYVRGLPVKWTMNRVSTFFGHQGKVVRVSMLPIKDNCQTRTAYVEFETVREAEDAMFVCNRLRLDDPEDVMLRCSIKHPRGRTNAEQRSVYMANLPPSFDEDRIYDLIEPYGRILDVNLLPIGSSGTMCCFVTMTSAEHTAEAIAGLDGTFIDGLQVEVRHPNPSAQQAATSDTRSAQRRQQRQQTQRPEQQVAGPEAAAVRTTKASRVPDIGLWANQLAAQARARQAAAARETAVPDAAWEAAPAQEWEAAAPAEEGPRRMPAPRKAAVAGGSRAMRATRHAAT